MVIEFIYEYDADTRILVRTDLADDDAPVQLFNADDYTKLNNPPMGSGLRDGLLRELGLRWLAWNNEVGSPKKVVLQ